MTPGFSGAELANVVNEGALLAVRQGHATIDQATLEEAIDRVVSGPAKKSHVLTAREREVIAIHEASHAVVARAIGQSVGGGAQKLSIVARGRTLGTATSQLVDKDVTVLQEPDLVRQLTAIVAGAAGERVHFGVLSTAINDDLHAATNLARSMVTSFGMSPELGLVTIGEQGGEVFLGASLQELGSVGPATLELIDREIERIVAEAVERADDRAARQLGRGARDGAGAARSRDGLRRRARGAADAGRADRDRGRAGQRAAAGRVIARAFLALALWAGLVAPAGAQEPAALAARAARAARRSAVPGRARGAWRPRPSGRRTAGCSAVEGNSVVPRGILAYDGESWHTLVDGLRRAGGHDADRLGRRPTSSGRSASRAARARARARRCAASRTARWSAPTRPPTTPPTRTAR